MKTDQDTFQVTSLDDVQKVLDALRITMESGFRFNKQIVVSQSHQSEEIIAEGIGKIADWV